MLRQISIIHCTAPQSQCHYQKYIQYKEGDRVGSFNVCSDGYTSYALHECDKWEETINLMFMEKVKGS